jgi:AcrR family transcriptional regulator
MASLPDRRVEKTREALYAALVSEILSNGYDAVTIQGILERANVGRSTFYGHFSGKEDLLRFGFDRLRSHLAAERLRMGNEDKKAATGPFLLSLFLLRHAQSHTQLYRAIIGGRGGLIAQQQIRAVIAEQIRLDIVGQKFDPEIPPGLIVEFLVGAFLSVLFYWLDKKSKLEPEAIDGMFKRIAQDGLKSLMQA